MKNIEVAKKYLNAVYTGDMATASNMLDPNIKLSMDGNNALIKNSEGIEDFFNAFGKMMELTANSYKLEEQVEWLEGEHRAVLIAVESAVKNGEKYIFNRVIDYGMENGKIAKVKIYEGEPTIADKVFVD